MTRTIRVFSLTANDHQATKPKIFTTELAALNALLDQLNITGQSREEHIEEHFSDRPDPEDANTTTVFFPTPKKNHPDDPDYRSFTIDPHDLEIQIPSVNTPRNPRLKDTKAIIELTSITIMVIIFVFVLISLAGT